MPVFACPRCNQPLRIADEAVGRSVKCPKCNTVFATKAPSSPAAVEAVQPATQPSRPVEAPDRGERIAASPVPLPPRASDTAFEDLASSAPSSGRRPSGSGGLTFMVVVKGDPTKRLKGRYQGSLTPEGMQLRQKSKPAVLIPRGSATEYLGGNRLSVALEVRPVQLQIAKRFSYQNRLTADLVAYLNGEKASLPARGYALPWYLIVLMLLPLGIPILTLGGVLPILLGGGLCALNALIVQQEKWPGVLRGILAAGLSLMGYGAIGILLLVTALLTYFRAHPNNTRTPSVSVQPAPPPGPAGKPPAPVQPANPPVAPAPDDLKSGPDIPRFYTAVVDPEAHLALFTEGQQLVRCDYPDFKQTSTYSLGEMSAFAGALDRARGLLYLAVCKPQALQGTNPIQRLLGTGDIHMHDVRALREGKVEAGSVLRPAAVIRLEKKITRLILSPDGRWLYYLDVTDGKNPKVGRIDAMARQPAGETALLEATEDISLAPDGKMLYAAGRPAPGKGAVQVIDTADLKVSKEVPLPGAPYGVAAAEGERVYVALMGQWTDAVALDVREGVVAVRWGGLYGRCLVQLAPDHKRLYVAITDLSPPTLQAWKLPEKPGEKPQKAAEVRGGATPQFLITPDGRFLLNREGKSFRLAGGNGS
jgi:hypothetical protein